MSDFFEKLKSGANKVAFEADKLARQNKAQGELNTLKHQKETLLLKLGELVYQQFLGQTAAAPEMDEICHSISDLENQLAAKEEEIKRISSEIFGGQPVTPLPAPQEAAPVPMPMPVPPAPVEPPPPAAPLTKFCTNCGKEMPTTVKFCPDCGAKMV